jgi:hypothetical protein
MTQYCVAALVKETTTINCELRLVLNHLWASESTISYDAVHLVQFVNECCVNLAILTIIFHANVSWMTCYVVNPSLNMGVFRKAKAAFVRNMGVGIQRNIGHSDLPADQICC